MKDSSVGQQKTALESEGQSPDRFRSFRTISQTTIASAIGIGAIYFLGRSYLDAYYRYFGIAPGALSFSTADYMFSCPNIILMLIVIIFFILGTWKSFQNEQPFFIDTSKKSFKEHIDELIMLPLLLILALSSYFAIIKGNPQGWAGTTNTSYIALMAGYGIGGLFFFAFWLFYYLLRSVFPFRPFILRPRQFFGIFWIVMVFVLLFAYLPYFSGKVADQVAFVEFQQFPEATIISDRLPLELQAPLVGDTYQVSAKIVVINNGALYIFKSNPDNVAKTSTISPSKGDIYAIKISDIKYLVYHPSGQPDR
jgi:hypothetical protein